MLPVCTCARMPGLIWSPLYTLCGVSQEAVTYPVAMSLGEVISVTLVTPPVTLSSSWSLSSLTTGSTAGVGAFGPFLLFLFFLLFLSFMLGLLSVDLFRFGNSGLLGSRLTAERGLHRLIRSVAHF